LIVFDAQNRLVRCNRRWREMFAAVADVAVPGAARQDIVRASIQRGMIALAEIDRDFYVAERTRDRDRPETIEARYGDRWFRYSDRPTPDGGTVGIRTDITEIKRAQAELARAKRMDAIGQLTGGIAHDFNNLLMIVLGNLEVLRDSPVADDDARELIDVAIQAGERGASLTRRLLAYSRRQSLTPQTCDLRQVLTEAVAPLLKHSVPESIEIEIQANDPVPAIYVDERELETAILNLVLNARDSMPQGGRIVIGVDVQTLDAGFVRQHGGSARQAGKYVCLSFSDTGTGIPPDVVDRVFEPFFTTKEVGQGTGLGLSMVYGFVKQSGGFVDLNSQLGSGTVFRLYFPVDGARTGGVLPAELPRQTIVKHAGARVLVVEDEKGVRELLKTYLTEAGYVVDTAIHAGEACDRLEDGRRYDLVVTDIVLPKGLSGFELAEIARRLLPGVEIIFMSGYPRLPDGRLIDGTGITLLEKPFTRDRLLAAIEAVLGGRTNVPGAE
jgi:signal transduction histidine kinase/CheY-like chemotaxis protein